MLSPSEAQHRILGLAPSLAKETLPLRLCNQRVLREDVKALDSYPDVPRARVDGYAIFLHRLASGETHFRLQAPASLASNIPAMMASDANALRVNAGDALPLGADGVVPLQAGRVSGHDVAVEVHPSWDAADTVLARGAWAQPGQTLLEEGHLIQATHLAWMATTGVEEVVVSKPPRILAIECGGTEPNAPALWALEALWQEWGSLDWDTLRVASPEEAWTSVRPNPGVDLIILLSRVNRADPRDPLMTLLRQSGVELRVNGVVLVPGGDLLAARLDGGPLLVLPPDPLPALACARRFVWPMLDRAAGIPAPVLRRLNLCGDVPAASDTTRLLPCRWSERGVESMPPLAGSEVASLVHTDGIMEVPPGPLAEGQSLLFFPWRRV